MSSLRIALIGAGRWGQNYLNACALSPQVDLRMVIDPSAEAQARAAQHGLRIASNIDAISANSIDAAIVAVGTAAHVSVADQCLRKGWHVLIEKPAVRTVAELKQLVGHGPTVVAAHLLVHHPAIARLRSLIGDNEIGELQSIKATRFTTRRIPSHAGPLWNLAIHDVSVIESLLGPATTTIDQVDVNPHSYAVRAVIGKVNVALAGGCAHSEHVRQIECIGSAGKLIFDGRAAEPLVLTKNEQSKPLQVETTTPLVAQLNAFAEACCTRQSQTGQAHVQWVTEVIARWHAAAAAASQLSQTA